ncbi:MAG TPA: type III-B CRISPR-associated protein Cas10/Cmr2 [Ignavibacteriales bacterium]|nr:type III-B CRISPR-associated protein Cas10/Cmr2 [Ignavibacteriales bacterium]
MKIKLWVIENLGCDHIIYPSIVNQLLINAYLEKILINEKNIEINKLNNNYHIANFPNKILLLIPYEYSSSIDQSINSHVSNKWLELKDIMLSGLFNKIEILEVYKKILKQLFNEQFENFCDLNWAASKFIDCNSLDDVKKLLPEVNLNLS